MTQDYDEDSKTSATVVSDTETGIWQKDKEERHKEGRLLRRAVKNAGGERRADLKTPRPEEQ